MVPVPGVLGHAAVADVAWLWNAAAVHYQGMRSKSWLLNGAQTCPWLGCLRLLLPAVAAHAPAVVQLDEHMCAEVPPHHVDVGRSHLLLWE